MPITRNVERNPRKNLWLPKPISMEGEGAYPIKTGTEVIAPWELSPIPRSPPGEWSSCSDYHIEED